MKKALIIVALFLVLTPMIAHGQQYFGNVQGLVNGFNTVIKILIPLVAAIALLYFFWGLAQFILAAGDEEAREKGKKIMIWGIVALFVMVAVWGLVKFLAGALGVSTTETVNVPTIGI